MSFPYFPKTWFLFSFGKLKLANNPNSHSLKQQPIAKALNLTLLESN
jgi:hypothetical protein